MADDERREEEESKCMVCQSNADSRMLLSGEYQGRQVWVCVACLPQLIHGAH